MKRIKRINLPSFEPSQALLRTGVELSLALSLGISCANLFWAIVPSPDIAPRPAKPVAYNADPSSNFVPGARENLAAVKRLFGGSEEQSSRLDKSNQVEPSRETALKLKLKGVLAHREVGKQLALIARGGKPEAVYSRGDVIAGAEILRIDARRVILNHNGVTESLTLEVEKLERVARQPAKKSASSSDVTKIADHQHVIERQKLEREVGRLDDLVKQAQAVPHIEQGRPAGLRVTRIQAGSVFDDLGLRQQDVIRSVNGSPVRSAQDAMQVYEALRSSNSYAIRVLRDGHEVTLNYAIQ